MNDLDFLIEVVKQASQIISEDFEVNAKGDDGDLVTNLDYEVEKFIIDKIKQNYPDFDIISEEFNSGCKLSENCFAIDPIDGTITFAHGCAEWAIQVACVRNHKTSAAVIYAPKLNELYSADEEKAYLNGKEIHIKNLPIKNCLYEINGKNRLSAFKRMMPYTKNYRRMGSTSVAFSCVAAGRFGGVIFRNDTVWDYLPGLHISKMAGAYIIDEPSCHIAANSKEFADILKENATYRPEDD